MTESYWGDISPTTPARLDSLNTTLPGSMSTVNLTGEAPDEDQAEGGVADVAVGRIVLALGGETVVVRQY